LKNYGDFGNPAKMKWLSKDLRAPIGTITATDHHSLVAAPLTEERTERAEQVCAFLIKYYKTGTAVSLRDPMHTLTTKHRMALVVVKGREYPIGDIGLRMLQARPELLRAQFGRFADSYDMSAAKTQKDEQRLIGNSVCPEVAEALVRANVPERLRRAA
jgi:DNA (cytosine-5)-methyltransferase 1